MSVTLLPERLLAAQVGKLVRRQRMDRNWSLELVATHAGVSLAVLVAVEEGRCDPSLGLLDRLGRVLEFSIDIHPD